MAAYRRIGLILGFLIVAMPETSLWAADAAILTAPGEIFTGGESSVTLAVLDGKTRQPLDRKVLLELVSDQGAASILFSGPSGSSGQLRIPFEVPDLEPGLFTFRVTLGSGVVLSAPTSVTSVPALLIETDKPVYRLSQTIRGRVVRLANDLRPVAGPVEVTFLDGKGIRVARQQLEADEYGVVSFSLDLASELNQGVWRIRARSEGVESVRDVRVEDYVLPRFELNMTLERGWALVDEVINGSVEAKYFFGKDVEGSVTLSASRWVGAWEEYAQLEGTLDNGTWPFELPPAGFVTGTPQNGGQGSVRIDIGVTDSTGHTQTITDSLLIAQAPVVLSLQSSSDRLKPGLPLGITVTSRAPDGTPVDTSVRLSAAFHESGGSQLSFLQEELTTRNGGVFWPLLPPERTAFADLEASVDAQVPATSIRLTGTYSPEESFLSLLRTDGSGPAQVGETLSFEVVSTHSGTVFYEIYAGGRTVFSEVTETGFFSFPVTVDMIPTARVVAYQIGSSNEIVADSLTFTTLLPVTATFEAGFDVDEVKPGAPVTVSIDTGMNRPALLGVSIVDQSVLYLGRSRLHLEQVFAELERRFMEPLAEVHLENDLPRGMGVPFFEPIPFVATKEIFAEAGLVVVTTDNLWVPEGFRVDFEDGVILAPGQGGGAKSSAAPENPRVRQYFPETWVWEPLLLTDAEGKATLTLEAPDSITGWRLAVVATQPDPLTGSSGIAFGESSLISFQDFFVEPSLPVSVVRGETLPLKLDIFNYLETSQEVRLTLQDTEGVEILGDTSVQTTIPAGSATSVEIPIRPTSLGEHPIQVTAIGSTHSDAVLRRLRVIAEGVPIEETVNGVLEAGDRVPLEIRVPAEAVKGSARSLVSITPSAVAQTMQGVSDLLGMPYGCGEQNMIFLAPDIEILKYLREIGELNPEIRAEAEYFVNVGYQRQLTFQTDDGGFAAFGGPDGSLWLTAFVLSTFSGAREVRDIDESVLQRAASMLVSRQNDDGSFQLDDFLIHTEMAGGVANEYAMAAFVTNALADYGGGEVTEALGLAAGFLEQTGNLTGVAKNPYPLAIAAGALFKIPGFEAAAEVLVERLLKLAIDEGPGIHWEPFPVETTGYAAIALLSGNQGVGHPEAQDALDWLATQRNSLGGYGNSTQDTVVALRALFFAASKVHRDLNVQIEVVGDGGLLASFFIDESNFDLLHQVVVPENLTSVELNSVGNGSVAYQLVTRYNLPGKQIPPARDLAFEVDYDTRHVAVDDLVDVRVRLTYTGPKGRTGMVIADVGVSTGFEAVQSSLDLLVKEKVVQRIERAGRKVIFYIESLEQAVELAFSFQILALYPVRAEGAVAQAYEYYDNSVQAFQFLGPVQILDEEVDPPVVDAVSQESGPGGSQITIQGSGFLSGPIEVFFNGIAALFEVIDDNTLLVTVPNLQPGEADIEVVTPGGRSRLASGPFLVKPFRLFYPLSGPPGGFIGYAFTNFSDRTAKLDLKAYNPSGELLQWPQNPRSIELGSGRQLALLEKEIFAVKGPVVTEGWVELSADNSEVGSLFQFGDFSRLDGASPSSSTARELWFSRIYEGPEAYRGQAAETWLTLANPHTEPMALRLSLVEPGADGLSVVEIGRTLQPGASFTERVGVVFDRTEIRPGAYVHVEVKEGAGVAGFERIELLSRKTSIGLAAWKPTQSSRFWSAHFASGPGIFTSLKLVNSGPDDRVIQVRIVHATGKPFADPVSIELESGTTLERDISELFPRLHSSVSLFVVGSVRVDVDGPGVVGDVLFGDPDRYRNAAALPLQAELFEKAIFSHLADNESFYTGVALHNPGTETARITLKVHRADGTLAGTGVTELGPGARLSKEVRELVPGARGQLGGYLIVESTEPIVAQQLFGDRGLETLSSVPPTVM